MLVSLEVWRDDVNAKGGLLGRPVELIYYDDQSNPSNVPSIYAKLISTVTVGNRQLDALITDGDDNIFAKFVAGEIERWTAVAKAAKFPAASASPAAAAWPPKRPIRSGCRAATASSASPIGWPYWPRTWRWWFRSPMAQ